MPLALRTEATIWPPGPHLPRRLQSWLYAAAPRQFAEACQRRYGDIVTLRMASSPHVVMVFEPVLVKQVLRGATAESRETETRGGGGALGSAARDQPWQAERVVGGRSVAMLDGAEHARRRRLLAPSLRAMGPRTLTAAISDVTDRAIDSWPVGEPFALLPAMQSLNFEVTLRALFGLHHHAHAEDLDQGIRAMRDAVLGRRGWGLGPLGARRGSRRPDFPAHRRAIDEFVYQEIARRRSAPELERRDDVLSMLVLGRDEDGRGLSDEELHDDLITLMIGAETPAMALLRAFELLVHNPAVLERLEAELADGDEAYLNAVVKETLRLHAPTVHVSRMVARAPCALGDFLLPPGTEVRVPTAAIHHAAHSYPEPHTFRPERFLGSGNPHADTWLPFGGGSRRCPGASLAGIEMAVVIRRVLERTQLAPARRLADRTTAVLSGRVQVPARGVRVVRWPRSGGQRRAPVVARGRQQATT